MKCFYLFTLLIPIQFVSGCFTSSSEPNPKDLDINMKRSAVKFDDAKGSATSAKPIVLQHYETIDWKSFFKPAPNSKQRSMLEQKLDSAPSSNDPQELLERGRKEVVVGRFAAANASFMHARRLAPDRADILLEIAKLHLRKHESDESFRWLGVVRGLIESNKSESHELVFLYKYVLALTHLTANDIKSGRKILSDLLGVDKSFTPAYTSLAYSYLKDDKVKIAEFIVKQGLDRTSDSASLQNLMGVVFQRQGDHDRAQKYFDRSLKIQPTFAPALINRAHSMIELGELEPAEMNLQKAINYSPGSVNAYIALAMCHKKMGRYQDAKANLNRAIDLDPDSAAARFHLGRLMMTKFNRPQAALRLFYEVSQVREKNEKISELARVYIDDINSKGGITKTE